jgi:hypothetical protein
MMKPAAVDGLVSARVLREFLPVVAKLRQLIREYGPDAE